MSFETWVDSQIARAREEGAFDDLDGAGKPLPRRTREMTSYDWALEKAGLTRVAEGDMAADNPVDPPLHYVYRTDRPAD